MNSVLTTRADAIAQLCRKYGVRSLYAFGSIVRPDFEPNRSDADFLVEFEPVSAADRMRRYFALRRELSQLVARPVDLTEEGSIRNPYVLENIACQKRLLYAA